MKTYQTLLCAFAIFAAFADGQPFDRYQTIIDRKPFGPEPANFDPNAAPGSASSEGAADSEEMTAEQRTVEEQKLASNVRISILNVAPDGTVKVGFTDSSAKPAENYYLKVGGSQNGWTVKSADPATESVTLEKGGVAVTMKLGEGTGGKGETRNAPKRGLLRHGFASGGNVAAKGAEAPAMGGLARLRQQRMEMEAKQREDAERKRMADAAAKAEQAAREADAAAERQRAEEEREQQREALFQIQEQLKKVREEREEREAARKAEQETPE